MKITVEKKLHRPVPKGVFPPRNAEYLDTANVEVLIKGSRIWLMLSKFSNEKEWYLDAKFINNLPEFCHGEGSRCCRKQAAQGPLLEAVEKAEFDNCYKRVEEAP
jgi:hypothetical protein